MATSIVRFAHLKVIDSAYLSTFNFKLYNNAHATHEKVIAVYIVRASWYLIGENVVIFLFESIAYNTVVFQEFEDSMYVRYFK